MPKISALLLVTLLTVAVATASTTTTSYLEKTATTRAVLGPYTGRTGEVDLNTIWTTITSPPSTTASTPSPIEPAITVEAETTVADKENDKNETMVYVDLSEQDKSLDGSLPNTTKVETNAVVDEAPKIIPTMSSEKDDEKENIKHMQFFEVVGEKSGEVLVLEDSGAENSTMAAFGVTDAERATSEVTVTKETTSGVTEAENTTFEVTEPPKTTSETPTTTKATTSTTTTLSAYDSEYKSAEERTLIDDDEDSDGVILQPGDELENVVDNANATDVSSTASQPSSSIWFHASQLIDRFANDNPKTSVLILALLFSILILLCFLVSRECLKRRKRFHSSHHRQHRLPSITADLYDTSSCSHRYSKITLPDNKEITMQLVSADNTATMV